MNITTPFTLKHHFCLRATIVACLIGVVAWAQPQKFQKVYGGYSYDQGNDLIQLPDTGYLLLCTSGSFSSSADIYLLKVDKQGNYEWQHTYGGQDIEGACKIKLTQDGHIAMAGHTNSYPGKSYDFYLVKAALNGDTVWTKHYGSNEWDFANSMDTCADGGFIMAGKTYDTGNAFSDILIVKTDTDGNELWQKKIGGNKDDVANSIVSTPNGYLICGTSFSAGNGGSDIYVALIDFSGNIVWENYYGDEYNDEGTGIYLSADNSVVFCGNRTTTDYPNNFNTYIRKIRYSGATYWATSNSTIGTSNMITNSIIEGFNKRVTTIGNFDLNSPGVNDVVLFLWDSTANYTESGTYGGSLEDYGKSVIKTSDWGYAAIGTTHSFGMGMSNIYFIKTDTVTPSNVNLTVYVGQEESIREPLNKQQPYPNPMNYTTTISLNYPITLMMDNQLVFKIFNQIGEQVTDKVAIDFKQNQNQTNITLTNLALSDGIYFYHLFSNDKTIAQGKFTVIK